MYACMSVCVYAGHLCDDKINTQHFIQSGRKLKFLSNRRPKRRSVGKEMEVKTLGMVVLDLLESQKFDVVLILLERMDRGFFIISCHR